MNNENLEENNDINSNNDNQEAKIEKKRRHQIEEPVKKDRESLEKNQIADKDMPAMKAELEKELEVCLFFLSYLKSKILSRSLREN